MKKLNLLGCTALGAIAAITASHSAHAQLQDEIIVTATKRAESAQDIAVTVTAIGEQKLDELGINVFTDYLLQLPGVTSGGNGPGQNTIYIRGLASTTPANSVAGVAGLAPNVALYLDEQPVSQPGRNLDIYAADLERVEVLSGPQGTLFGASSQAGTVRLITNKPKLGVFEASSNFGVSFTDGGESSNFVEAVINVPVTDKFAVRGVFYNDDQGGYIDNVSGSRTAFGNEGSAPIGGRFRPVGTVRQNGIPVNSFRGGFQAGSFDADSLVSTPNAALVNSVGADGSTGQVTFLRDTNEEFAENNFNDTTYTGFRISGLYEFNNDWNLTVQHGRQQLDSQGTFFVDPTLGDLEVQRFTDDTLDDRYSNTSWTLEGKLGILDAVYTGAFTDRQTEQVADYTDYAFVGQYLPYYICDGSVTYPGDAAPTGTCQAPTSLTDSTSDTEIQTHELRFNTPAEYAVRATVGGFYSDLILEERNNFNYLGSAAPGVAFGSTAVTNFVQPAPAFSSLDEPFGPTTVFRNDVRRTDEQIGIFGEVTWQINEQFALTGGARYFDIEVDLEGSANATFCNGSGVDENAFGTNISDQFDGDGSFTFIGSCNDDLRQTFTLGQSVADIQAAGLSLSQATQVFNALSAPESADTDGVIFKASGSYTPNDDLLFYATFSEGFRPGFLNRPGGAVSASGFEVPFAVETDEVTNYELGWKTTLLENQLRFNGSAFFVDISDLQTTIFDPSITNLFFNTNAADAEIFGLEADIVVAPEAIPGLTVTGAISLLDTQITDVLLETSDVIDGADLAFAPTFQGNMTARYEWDASSEFRAHVQGSAAYSSEQDTDIIEINRVTLDDWLILGGTAGISTDGWAATLFIDNITNSRAQTSGFFNQDVQRNVITRPRTIGARFAVNFR